MTRMQETCSGRAALAFGYGKRSGLLGLGLAAALSGVLGCSDGGGTGPDTTGMPDMGGSTGDPDMATGTAVQPTGFPELPAAPVASGRVLSVGPGKTYAKPCAALTAATDGDTIEISAGSYTGDTCQFGANNLTIRGVGGKVVLGIDGTAPARCKGLWVIGGKDVLIEDVEFSGAHLRPNDTFVQGGTCAADKNGAGIRWEGGNLTLRRCSFHDNDNGILGGNDAQAALLIERSVFQSNSRV